MVITKAKLYTYITYLAFAGMMLSIYLLWQQLFRPAFQPCSINSVINCDAVISGQVAKTFGVSTPLYGLVGYIVMLICIRFRKPAPLFYVATGGLVFCLWLAYVELFQLKVICPVCIGCQLIMAAIWVLAIKLRAIKGKAVSSPDAL